MPRLEYVCPEFGVSAFNCPYCNAYAQQSWYCMGLVSYDAVQEEIRGYQEFADSVPSFFSMQAEIRRSRACLDYLVSVCARCNQYAYWLGKRLVYPHEITAPMANQNMPESVLVYFDEARGVSAISPRSAAALLRIAAKKLCEFLGEEEPNLNCAIGNLSRRGLPRLVIEALDAVRIFGNEGGAHEGAIDLSGKDTAEVVNGLFKLVNFIVEKTISDQKEIEEISEFLPEDKKSAAIRRDK